MTLVDQDHIGWKSYKLIAQTISAAPSLYAIYVMRRLRLYNNFCSSSQNAVVKELLKSVHIPYVATVVMSYNVGATTSLVLFYNFTKSNSAILNCYPPSI